MKPIGMNCKYLRSLICLSLSGYNILWHRHRKKTRNIRSRLLVHFKPTSQNGRSGAESDAQK